MVRLVALGLLLILSNYTSAQESSEQKGEIFLKGYTAFDNQEWIKAISLFDTWIENYPRDTDAYWLRGQSLERIENYEEALTDLSILLTIDPTNAEAYFARGRIRYQLKQYQSAIEDFEGFLYTPAGATTRIIYRQGAGDKGVSQVTTAQSGNPAEAYYHLGLCSFEMGEYDQAIEYFDSAIEFDDTNPDYYAEKGRSFARFGDNMFAISQFEEALALDPNHLPAKQGLAQVKTGGDESLISLLDEVIADGAAGSQTYKQRGFYRMYHGDSTGAIEDFGMAIQLDSVDTESYFYRGKIFAEKKMWRQAESDYSIALSFEKENADYYLARGQARYSSGKLKEALADFTLTVARDPKNSIGYYHRGITLQRLKRMNEACTELQKAGEMGMIQAEEVWKKVCGN
jgi:tetratricopeptide (TPR) repeat protein